ncbi:4-(cytidine 5'-diphospho)-2-C-methyl-D-erythritol kinase [Chondrinema litorale]|uniref:4-(cytidine 5'-diphospho)-2-C-methyl-D-erythritol kinase n=1 Tax=Chondrinema litorale TaxID=2994555 RepID=UPI0025429CF1|nr:4-(cytidine 5'-diphospho)-2-C-methyl-D-erythritol kinase [Chondrinema litorale]UZR93582.1 4-(cytidine 5'-diphospho)-2-C-methyl-D-erythritol kinase [Chondrinema litorale]
MLVFPNAKINLGLNILNKRPDGYHNIASCFYPVEWCDVLEIVHSDKLEVSLTGIPIPGNKDQNLIVSAYHLIKQDFDISPVKIHLHKVIPIGAGLGGGSADCAFAIKVYNELFKLDLSTQQMEEYAGKLGSDCPFFIENKPVNVSGTGNIFEKTELSLAGKHILLVYPDLHISTVHAYSGVLPNEPQIKNADILNQPIKNWKDNLVNDFERSVFPQFPATEKLKSSMYEHHAIYVSMTGSGSAVYGIFEEKPDIQFPKNYQVFHSELK